MFQELFCEINDGNLPIFYKYSNRLKDNPWYDMLHKILVKLRMINIFITGKIMV